ncbi:hypothetical protein Tco_1303092 [Tanacetum coccineum]
MPTEMELTLEQTQQGVSYEVSVILTDLKVTPTKPGRMTKPYSSPRFIATLLSKLFKDGVEVPNFKKDATLKHSKAHLIKKGMINVQSISHSSPKMAKFQDGVKRLCLVDDLKMLKITTSNTSSRNKLNPEINDHYNISIRESQEYELKTKDKA